MTVKGHWQPKFLFLISIRPTDRILHIFVCLAHSVVEKIDRNVVRTAAILKIVPYANLCWNTFVTSLVG